MISNLIQLSKPDNRSKFKGSLMSNILDMQSFHDVFLVNRLVLTNTFLAQQEAMWFGYICFFACLCWLSPA